MSDNVPTEKTFKSKKKLFRALGVLTCAFLFFVASPSKLYAQSELDKAQSETESLAHRVAGGVVSLSASGRFGRSGTGFVFGNKWIVSSIEVVGNVGANIRVTFIEGIKGTATVKARDPLSHFALLELKNAAGLRARLGKRWNPLKLGDSAKVRSGQFIFTIGDAFRSVSGDGIPALSMGSVTRLGRISDGFGNYRGKVIEIDAAVNTGGFGGPVLDLKGRVVGMVSSGYSKRRWFGTAVPINNFKSIINKLRSGEKPQGGSLGLAVEDTRGMASKNGVAVLDLAPGGAAEKAGVVAGDRILSIDGNRVYDADDIARELGLLPSGTVIQLKLLRGAQTLKVNVELQPGKATTTISAGPARIYLGLSISGDLAKTGGVIITKVKKDSPFAKQGVKKGDALVRFGAKVISSKSDLRAALKGFNAGDKVTVVVSRGGWEKVVTIVLFSKGDVSGATKTVLSIGVRVRKSKAGAAITKVAGSSSAAKVGLKKGDVILFGLLGTQKHVIGSAKDLQKFLGLHRAGMKARLVVSRGGWDKEVQVEITATKTKGRAKKGAWLGLKVRKSGNKFVVSTVEAGSPADKAGIKKGDVLRSVEGKAVNGQKALNKILSGKKAGQKLKLTVARGGWGREFELTLSRRK